MLNSDRQTHTPAHTHPHTFICYKCCALSTWILHTYDTHASRKKNRTQITLVGNRCGRGKGWGRKLGGNCSLAVSWTGVAFIRVATRQPQPQATTRLKLILHTCPMWQKQDSTIRWRERGRDGEWEREKGLLNVLLFCKGYTKSERSNKPVKLYLHATRCLQCPCYKYADAWRKIQARRSRRRSQTATHATATTD